LPRGIRVTSAFAQRVVLALLGTLLLGALHPGPASVDP
jgi:hypothetical protein